MANLRVDKITSTETFETTGSVQFHQDNNNYLSGTITAIGTQDFTIECWVYLIKVRSAENQSQRIFGNEDGAFDDNTVNMRFTPNTTIEMYYGASPGNVTSDTLSESTWYHIAMSYSDNIARCYVDGKEFGRIYGNHDLGNTTMFIGGTYTVGGENFNGYVSNARLIVGKGIYPENFKPPMRELEVTPETVLLACQSKTDKLEERSGNTTLSATGTLHSASELTPGLLTPVPKAGAGSAITGSVEFDGTGDCLTAPDGSDFEFGSDNFTIEAYIYYTGSPGTSGDTYAITSKWDNQSAPNDKGLILRISDDGSGDNLQWFYTTDGSTNDTTTGSTILSPESWYHIAFVRNGTVGTFYINGIADATTVSFGSDSIRDTGNPFRIGANLESGAIDQEFQGYISNLRVIKGTALYTEDFIPPTRELKKVPGTVLLCCQDPDSPLTEATGKTITGFGDLDQVYNTQLVPNGDFSDGTNDWSDTGSTATLSVSSGQMTITNSSGINGRATGSAFDTTIGARYILKYDAITTGGSYRAEIRQASGGGAEQAFESTTDGVTETFEFQATHSRHSVVIYSIGANGVATKYDNVYVYKVLPGKTGSNFTPQVGDDRKVTFEGVTKINSDAYFYLPTGDTVTRESRYGRGLIVGGSNSNAIEYINISTLGNSQDYGDLSAATSYVGALASSTRGVYSRSRTPSSPNGDNTLEYSTLASTGNSLDFGDRTVSVYEVGALSNNSRGIIGGGYGSSNSDVMDYITVASTGNAIDFGNLTQARRGLNGLASPTRGCFAAGYQQPDTTTETDIIDYVTIASTGNALDFGDLIAAVWGPASLASPTRGIWAGGIDPNATAVINYVTISSTGNAQDFGDLTVAKGRNAGMSNSTRGVIGLEGLNTMDYITIATTGNAQDFGDMMRTISGVRGACSDSHGGLG